MLRRLVAFSLSITLLWTGLNVCLMPQAECEGQTRPPCHCEHGSQPKCCAGVHLVEAGIGYGLSVAHGAQPFQQAVLPPAAAAPAAAAIAGRSLALAAPAVPRHPPPRDCSGRSPPSA